MQGSPGQPFTVGVVQTTSAREYEANRAPVSDLVRRAAAAGAGLILLPENVALLEPDPVRLRAKAAGEAEHPALPWLAELARQYQAWLLVGSLAVRVDAERIANRSLLLTPQGRIAARYDKIHLFDVELANGESYRESATMVPGDRLVVADLPWGRLGLSVCYDLRFPHLYRRLAQAGADFLSVPAAFTRTTGQAHWHVLQRARAIETGCYVFAAAQCGEHAEGRKTYGHALIVDPLGVVLADAGEAEGVITALIEPARVAAARRAIPAIHLERSFD